MIHFSLFLQWNLRETAMEFDLLFCRLWQFFIGTFVFILNKKDEAKFELETLTSRKMRTLFFGSVLLLIFICIMPPISTTSEYKFVVRLLATLFGGIAVYTGCYVQLSLPVIIDLCLTYVGDISYSFYLVHWPIILFGRYMNMDSNVYGFVSIVIICIVAAVLLYELLDKIIPTKSTLAVFAQTGVIFGLILTFCFCPFSSNSNVYKQKLEMTQDLGAQLPLEEIIRLNEEFDKSCSKLPISDCNNDPELYNIFRENNTNKNWMHSCVVDLNESGTKTILLLGNSYVSRFSYTAVEVLKNFPSVKKMYLVTKPSCTMFDTLLKIETSQGTCSKMIGKNLEVVKTIRPDIVIHVAR